MPEKTVRKTRKPPEGAGSAAMAPPSALSAEARVVWEQTVPRLPPDADPQTFAAYCSAVADYQRAQALLDQTGPLTQSGARVLPSPLQTVKRANLLSIRALGRDLGLLEPEKGAVGTRNTRGAERTIAALRAGGRLEQVDDATLALVRTIAAAMDRVDPGTYPAQLASLARAQLAALKMLRGINDDDDDSLDELLATLSAPMGDAPES
jgi:phage terminase small subunit